MSRYAYPAYGYFEEQHTKAISTSQLGANDVCPLLGETNPHRLFVDDRY